jgi:hypothetical protein
VFFPNPQGKVVNLHGFPNLDKPESKKLTQIGKNTDIFRCNRYFQENSVGNPLGAYLC